MPTATDDETCWRFFRDQRCRVGGGRLFDRQMIFLSTLKERSRAVSDQGRYGHTTAVTKRRATAYPVGQIVVADH